MYVITLKKPKRINCFIRLKNATHPVNIKKTWQLYFKMIITHISIVFSNMLIKGCAAPPSTATPLKGDWGSPRPYKKCGAKG